MTPGPESALSNEARLLIGRRERVDFPEWGLRNVRAKVDTGAYHSALDVAGYDLVETNGLWTARLRLNWARKRDNTRAYEARVVRTVTVANSSGGRECRPLIE